MDLLILPGYKADILSWALDMQRRLAGHFDAAYVHQYKHWETGDEEFAWDYELDQIAAHLEGVDDFGILALSIGTMLALKGVHERGWQPRFCVFMGTSVAPPEDPQYDLDLFAREYAAPTLFVQQTNDPAGSFADLKALFAGHPCAQFVETEGDDHWYADEEDCDLVEEHLLALADSVSA
jgi:hypothetical protein